MDGKVIDVMCIAMAVLLALSITLSLIAGRVRDRRLSERLSNLSSVLMLLFSMPLALLLLWSIIDLIAGWEEWTWIC